VQMMIDVNHSLISCLGINHEAIESVVAITKKYGLHSKLTGSGGGGCLITFIPDGTLIKVMIDVRL
jgi:mevalonate kinase